MTARRARRRRAITPDEAAHFAPALLALALASADEVRARLLGTLAEVVRRDVVKGQVPGAEWAQQSGCGTTYETRDQNIAIGCGMGHVPARSQRFLHFYTMKPSEW